MSENKEMSFLEHLEELRGRLFKAMLGVVVAVIAVLAFDDFVIEEIIMAPRRLDFISYRLWCDLSHFLGLGDTLCFKEIKFSLQSTTMGGNFSSYLLVVIVGGVILSFPWVVYQLWCFIKPGLNAREISNVRGIVFYISLLFFLGVFFGYYILCPLSITFLGNFEFSDVPVTSTVLSYLKLNTSLLLGTGLIFQLPVLMYFLGQLGIVTSAMLKKYRKHALVINLIAAAIITPPDITSQILVALPILLLYEISILVVARVEKKRALK